MRGDPQERRARGHEHREEEEDGAAEERPVTQAIPLALPATFFHCLAHQLHDFFSFAAAELPAVSVTLFILPSLPLLPPPRPLRSRSAWVWMHAQRAEPAVVGPVHWPWSGQPEGSLDWRDTRQ